MMQFGCHLLRSQLLEGLGEKGGNHLTLKLNICEQYNVDELCECGWYNMVKLLFDLFDQKHINNSLQSFMISIEWCHK